jgi:hypothetical protein
MSHVRGIVTTLFYFHAEGLLVPIITLSLGECLFNTFTSTFTPESPIPFQNAGIDGKIILNLNSVNQLIFVMVKCGVLFEVRTGFLNNI